MEIVDHNDGHRLENINFILDIGNGKVEELISYNQLLDHLKTAQENDISTDQDLFKFRAIIRHQGPLKATDPDWKGSNIMSKLSGRVGRLPLNPSLLLLLMTQLLVLHMPSNMIFLLWKDGEDSRILPRKIKF